MIERLVIVGAGGFGREVLAIVAAINAGTPTWKVEGFVDDGPSDLNRARVAACGSTVLGPVESMLDEIDPPAVVIAVGSPSARAAIADRLASGRFVHPVLVHPDATVCPDAILGMGTVIAPGARISTNAVLGRHVHVDQNATIGHDCELADFVRLNPQACVSGSVKAGAQVLVGAAATVMQGLTIGAGAVVGAAACVVRDVPAGAVVKGVPAR